MYYMRVYRISISRTSLHLVRLSIPSITWYLAIHIVCCVITNVPLVTLYFQGHGILATISVSYSYEISCITYIYVSFYKRPFKSCSTHALVIRVCFLSTKILCHRLIVIGTYISVIYSDLLEYMHELYCIRWTSFLMSENLC